MKEIDEKKKPKSDEQVAEAARERHFRKYLRETDQSIVESLSEKYRHVASAERIKALADVPTRFEDRDAFDRHLAAAGGEPPADGRVLGFTRFDGEPAHVATDQ